MAGRTTGSPGRCIVFLITAALAGCQPQGVRGPSGVLGRPAGMVSAADLARRWGMTVAYCGRASATLRSAANTVVLSVRFAETDPVQDTLLEIFEKFFRFECLKDAPAF